MGENTTSRLVEALAARKVILDKCPIRKSVIFGEECPTCHSTMRGPCWLNVEADAAFVDAVKEIALTPTGASHD